MNTLVELRETGSQITQASEQSPAKIILRSQCPSDQETLQKICALDQERQFVGRWDGFNYVLTEQPKVVKARKPEDADEALAAEISKCKVMPEGKLKTLAAQRGVEWDVAASHETMVERVAKAKK